MNVEIRWLPSRTASCTHAVHALRQGWTLSDSRLAEALSPLAAQLARQMAAANWSEETAWRHLIPLSAGIPSPRELARVALTKTLGASTATNDRVALFADRLAELQRTFDQALPRLAEDLPLRVGPLREAWEARGPGLLRRVAQLSDERLLVEAAEVILVHPALGGSGAAHLAYNSARIEAVLTNPQPQLPEVVRLAWLLSQLNLDLPLLSEGIHRERLPAVAALAMLPIILAAAEYVELTRCDQQTLQLAIEIWRLASAGDAVLPETVWAWWETYSTTRPTWPVALAALDRMLSAAHHAGDASA